MEMIFFSGVGVFPFMFAYSTKQASDIQKNRIFTCGRQPIDQALYLSFKNKKVFCQTGIAFISRAKRDGSINWGKYICCPCNNVSLFSELFFSHCTIMNNASKVA